MAPSRAAEDGTPSISEDLGDAIAVVEAMAAGEIPISEGRLSRVWKVDQAATKALEGLRRKGEEARHPIEGRLHELYRAVDSNPGVKRAHVSAWVRHMMGPSPDPDEHYRLIMSTLDALMAEHEAMGVLELIASALEISAAKKSVLIVSAREGP